MPELPEVETIKRYLADNIVGKKIKEIKIFKPKSFIGKTGEVIGARVNNVERRAKLIIIGLSNKKSLLIHLKLTGQLLISPPRCKNSSPRRCLEPTKYTGVIIEFGDGTKLLFNDLRMFGWMKVISKIKNQISKMGPEPFSKEFTIEYLQKIFSRTKRPIKLVLMDQEKIAGIGNIYANEILFEAGIAPVKPAQKLRNLEIKKLREAILRVLKEAIKYKGSSAKDEQYVQATGEKGGYQNHFRVYQREGEQCRLCGTLIKRIRLGGRGTFFCQKCQR